MPQAQQTRLLRVLAEGEVLPLGAAQPVRVDLQVICATHRDLMDLVESGALRLDLYYRLNGLTLTLLALRDRLDKASLIEAVAREEARSLRRGPPRIAANAMGVLLGHAWPGNIRELKSALGAALALGDTDTIALEHLPAAVLGTVRQALPPPRISSLGFDAAAASRSNETGEPQRESLLAALRKHHWNVTQTARSLQTCRATVYRRMQRLDIVAPNRRE